MAIEPAPSALPAGLSANAFSSLFQAVGGLRNRRAIVALLGCLFAGIIVASLVGMMATSVGPFAVALGMLIWIVALGTGINAAGLLQMDQARGISPRSTVDALVYGLLCIPKLLALALLFFAAVLAVFLAIALLLLLCKIPVLGAVLFVVVFPLSVVAAGVALFGAAICTLLSAPAVWQGASITRALAQTLAIARSRLVDAVLLLVFVGILSMAVAFLIFGVLAGGLVPTLGMSWSIVGFGPGDVNPMMGMMQGGRGAGHVIAGTIGGLLLWAVAASLVGQVYLLGLSLVYLRVTEGLDVGATEAALRGGLDEARRRGAELGERARHAAQRDAAPAATAATPVAPAAAATGAFAPPQHPFGVPPVPPQNPFSAAPPTSWPPRAAAPVPAAPGSADPGPDIALPLDDEAGSPTQPAYASPPAWMPPPTPAPLPEAPPPPALTACPQCLSAVTDADVFCGVCGFRLK